ncbi:hypothetical protein CONPUDRAFT_83152 [Coniophora puteana RWD-64-598 SS2]|uniref:Uncharacterized protein n=1 Tax=Coniophora puteana (strain RWD-64-598) TaxID=741705 RepID=A0A5M3MMT6_CONPW|nr:uncharacterized protein CONPUDRAFT_83152 [Coniophora puteana RWD-64-598 SS2]EIW79921.1 hypothetical protein CONPUDRAFT_83152 [Coniophora puteana RWD-64-598 SS2]
MDFVIADTSQAYLSLSVHRISYDDRPPNHLRVGRCSILSHVMASEEVVAFTDASPKIQIPTFISVCKIPFINRCNNVELAWMRATSLFGSVAMSASSMLAKMSEFLVHCASLAHSASKSASCQKYF